jgi:hypothetical protein
MAGHKHSSATQDIQGVRQSLGIEMPIISSLQWIIRRRIGKRSVKQKVRHWNLYFDDDSASSKCYVLQEHLLSLNTD